MLVFFFQIAFVYIVVLGVFWIWHQHAEKQVREASDVEWDIYLKKEPDFVDHLNRESFYLVFRKTHFPRFLGYVIACIGTFLGALPIIFAGLYGGVYVGSKLGWIPNSSDIANRFLIEGDRMRLITDAPSNTALYLVENAGGFYYFFGVIFSWLLIVAFFTRHYHVRRPGYLRDEIIRSR